jgi:hypothetical protein
LYPRFIAGINRAPPEDVRGLPGFEHHLKVMADPTHPEHADIAQLYGNAFNSTDISEAEIIIRTDKLTKRRAPRKAGSAKTKRKLN